LVPCPAFSSLLETRSPSNSCRTGLDRRPAGCGQTRPCWIDPDRSQPQLEHWTRAGSLAGTGLRDRRCLSWGLSAIMEVDSKLLATCGSMMGKTGRALRGRPCPATACSRASSVAVRSVSSGSTERLVVAIARGNEVTLPRYRSTRLGSIPYECTQKKAACVATSGLSLGRKRPRWAAIAGRATARVIDTTIAIGGSIDPTYGSGIQTE
jgi:hypothetical protein